MDETPELLRQRIAWQCGQLIALEAAFSFLVKSTEGAQHLLHISDQATAFLETYYRSRLASIQSPDAELTKSVFQATASRLDLSRQRSAWLEQAMFPMAELMASDYGAAEKAKQRKARVQAHVALAKAKRRTRKKPGGSGAT